MQFQKDKFCLALQQLVYIVEVIFRAQFLSYSGF